MQPAHYQKFQEISKLYKEIVGSITNFELPQLKLYLVNLQKGILQKSQPLLSEYESLKVLLDTTKEAKGKVPLHFACARGNVQIVRYLIENIKLDYKIRDKEGNSPFFTALEHGHLDLVRYFVQELNSSVNQTKDGEISTLHITANHNHLELLNYLINKGADLERISIYGKPIDWAVGSRNFQSVKILLQHGANPNGDGTGSHVSPIILAVDFDSVEIYHLLIEKGANINAKDTSGYSVLHVAAQKGDLQIVQDLVKRGADVNLQVEGKSPLYLAFEHQKWDVVNMLKQYQPDYEKLQQKIKQQSTKKQQQLQQPNKQRAQEIKNIGNKFYAEKQYTQALQEYHKALAYDTQNTVIHRNIAACYLALHQYERAFAHCQKAKVQDPKNVKTLYREAQACIGLGNLIDASSAMWECSLLQPSNALFRSQFMRLVQQAKKKHKASTH